jgi:membrane-bound serine protease (ClpP class)
MKKALIVILLFISGHPLFSQTVVHRIIINGVINPIATEYIIQSIERADKQNAELLVIELDTPGGLMESMHQIVKAIQASDVPVAVYVAPSGSRAGSAGVFITYAAHIAAMTSSTNIGSAHPVFGQDPTGNKQDSSSAGAMMEKVVNDAVAKIRSMAEKRHRNADWAEKAVRESANITESEALKLKVIDYVTPSLDSLLKVINGKVIALDSGASKKLDTRQAQLLTFEMSIRQRILDTIIDPNVAYFLMMFGVFGLMFELYNPGSILPGIVGAICLITGLYSMETLSVNYAGLLLIIFAIIMFLLEIKVTSYGLLSIGGVISMIMGSIMLFDSPLPFMRVSLYIIVTFAILSALFFVFAIGMTLRTHRKPPTTGTQGMVGEIGKVIRAIDPEGTVMIHGEYWRAASVQPIAEGRKVRVIEVDSKSLKIIVEGVES